MFQRFAKTMLKVLGWRVVYTPPPSPHGIIIVYPHTSNWDFLFGILWKLAVDTRLRWIAKHTWFRPPIGWFMRRLGGIGIRREGQLDLTTQLRNTMLAEEECWLCIAPEGTRSHKNYIHMGYYHIAMSANVPLGLGFIDYKTKTVGVQEYRMAKSTIDEELAQLAVDFKNVQAYKPNQVGLLKQRPTK